MDPLHISYRFSIPGATPPPGNKQGYISAKRWSGILANAWFLAALAVAAVSVWAHMLIGLNNDHLTLTDQTRRMLAGQIPYVDYTDIGPPLIHLIYALPVTLAEHTGLPLYVALYGFTFAAIALALFTSERLLKYSGVVTLTRRTIIATLAIALLTVSFIHQVFADREHLMLVLATPWFILYSPWVRRESVPLFWRLPAAAMAAVGFVIKPYFYVFYIATIAFELYRKRSLSTFGALLRQPEHYIVCGFALAYIAAIFIFFHTYITTIMPVGLETYGAISWAWDDKMSVIKNDLITGYALTGFLALLVVWLWVPGFYDTIITYVLFLMLASIGSYVLNGGWYYTQYPFMVLAFALMVATGGKLIQACTYKNQRIALIVICALLAAGLYHYYADPIIDRAKSDIAVQRDRGHPLENPEIQVAAATKLDTHFTGHPRFIFLSTNFWSVNLRKTGTPRDNVGRFDYLWPLPGIVAMDNHPDKKKTQDWLTRYMGESVADDLNRHMPDMVIVDISPYQRALPTSYKILGFFNRNPQFVTAWRHYRLVDTINACNKDTEADCAYEVYYRN